MNPSLAAGVVKHFNEIGIELVYEGGTWYQRWQGNKNQVDAQMLANIETVANDPGFQARADPPKKPSKSTPPLVDRNGKPLKGGALKAHEVAVANRAARANNALAFGKWAYQGVSGSAASVPPSAFSFAPDYVPPPTPAPKTPKFNFQAPYVDPVAQASHQWATTGVTDARVNHFMSRGATQADAERLAYEEFRDSTNAMNAAIPHTGASSPWHPKLPPTGANSAWLPKGVNKSHVDDLINRGMSPADAMGMDHQGYGDALAMNAAHDEENPRSRNAFVRMVTAGLPRSARFAINRALKAQGEWNKNATVGSRALVGAGGALGGAYAGFQSGGIIGGALGGAGGAIGGALLGPAGAIAGGAIGSAIGAGVKALADHVKGDLHAASDAGGQVADAAVRGISGLVSPAFRAGLHLGSELLRGVLMPFGASGQAVHSFITGGANSIGGAVSGLGPAGSSLIHAGGQAGGALFGAGTGLVGAGMGMGALGILGGVIGGVVGLAVGALGVKLLAALAQAFASVLEAAGRFAGAFGEVMVGALRMVIDVGRDVFADLMALAKQVTQWHNTTGIPVADALTATMTGQAFGMTPQQTMAGAGDNNWMTQMRARQFGVSAPYMSPEALSQVRGQFGSSIQDDGPQGTISRMLVKNMGYGSAMESGVLALPQKLFDRQMDRSNQMQSGLGLDPSKITETQQDLAMTGASIEQFAFMLKTTLAGDALPYVEHILDSVVGYLASHAQQVSDLIKSAVHWFFVDFPPMVMNAGAWLLHGAAGFLEALAGIGLGLLTNLKPILTGFDVFLNGLRSFAAFVMTIGGYVSEFVHNLAAGIGGPSQHTNPDGTITGTTASGKPFTIPNQVPGSAGYIPQADVNNPAYDPTFTPPSATGNPNSGHTTNLGAVVPQPGADATNAPPAASDDTHPWWDFFDVTGWRERQQGRGYGETAKENHPWMGVVGRAIHSMSNALPDTSNFAGDYDHNLRSLPASNLAGKYGDPHGALARTIQDGVDTINGIAKKAHEGEDYLNNGEKSYAAFMAKLENGGDSQKSDEHLNELKKLTQSMQDMKETMRQFGMGIVTRTSAIIAEDEVLNLKRVPA